MPPPPAVRSKNVWAPGGTLNFDRAESTSEMGPSITSNAPLTLGAGSAAASSGGGGSMANAEVLALAQTFMPSETSLQQYADAHGIEAVLGSALNTIAKTRPKDPFQELVKLLPRDTKLAYQSVHRVDGLEGELEKLQRSWLTLHGMEEGEVC